MKIASHVLCLSRGQVEPWAMKKRDKWEGYFPTLLASLSTIMDFDYDIVHLSTLGERGNSTSWSGGIGLLAKGVCLFHTDQKFTSYLLIMIFKCYKVLE